MSASSKVQAALFSGVKDALDGKAVQWPNRAFTPESGSLWFKVSYVPADRFRATLGDEGEDHVKGFIQIDVNAPAGAGESASRTELDALEVVFQGGEVLVYSGQEVTILACKRSNGREVDGFWRTSLTIDFYARLRRMATEGTDYVLWGDDENVEFDP